MSKKKIMFVFGTRPEAVKMAPVIIEAKKHAQLIVPVVVVTGQHREMLDQVTRLFDIKPDHDLTIMEEGQSVSHIVSQSLLGLEKLIPRIKPDMVLVQGDTSTTFAASLASYYQKIPLAHIEAGLRTRDKYRPFPEELNRRLTSAVADINFAPTRNSVQNLVAEGISRDTIYITGNTVIDALQMVLKMDIDSKSQGFDLPQDGRKTVLVTAHRRESFGAPLRNICEAIKEIALSDTAGIRFVIPVHKNPEVSRTIRSMLTGLDQVKLIEPLDYAPFIQLMKRSYIILTDSGGVQEEAPSLGKPVLVLRETTERPEAVECGAVKVVGMDRERIVKETKKLLYDRNEYEKMSRVTNPYGDGKASERIIGILLNHFGLDHEMPKEFAWEKVSSFGG